ncbi:MAG: hypothetical protein K8J08_02785 [Thermoanaerobaculia bacterium]|nr:hypothetical protein [Thermoanaerobaculia bacterium]
MSPRDTDIRFRLQAYSALGVAFLLTAPAANGAVQHTDPADIPVGPGESFNVNLDGNATNDVLFRVSSNNVYGSPLTGASLTGSGGATFCYPYQLSSGASISPGATWTCTTAVTFHSLNYGSSSFGNWPSGTSGYIGVRFDIAGETHYGWVHLQMTSNNSLVITDWAYEDVPDTPIAAGTVPVELMSFSID